MIGFWGCVGRVLAWLPLNSFSSCLWLMCVTHSDVLMPLYRLSDFLMASSPAVTFVVNKVLEIRGCWELSQGRVEAQQEIRAHLSSLSHSLTHSTPPSCTELLLMSLLPLVSSFGEQEALVAVFAFTKVLWCANFFLLFPCLPLFSLPPLLSSPLFLLPPFFPPSPIPSSPSSSLPILCITGWAETHYVTNNELLIFLYFWRCVLPWLIYVVLGVETRVCVW